MAKQKGIIKIEGTLGDITFVKTKDGYLAKEKTSVNGKRINTDIAFQRTRENAAEFGRAGKAGKVLRMAVRSLSQFAKDGRMVSRLTKEMTKAIKADLSSGRGDRNVVDGEAELLKGFEFNSHAQFSSTFSVQYTATIDRAAGKLEINIPGFSPTTGIAIPGGATHYKLVSAGAEIDFEAGSFVENNNSTDIMSWDEKVTAPIVLSNTVTAGSKHPLFLLLGILFYQEVNGVKYPLKNGAYNSLAIVIVSGQ